MMNYMDKKQIVKQLEEKVNLELKKITQAYETTKNLVQAGDLKSDGKYDTRGTEANYLADGQRQRIHELEQELELLADIPTNKHKDTVAIGSLVDIELNGNTRTYFIAPTAGGTMLSINAQALLVISVFSPIGNAVLGLAKGDDFEIELKGEQRIYEVISIK